MKVVEEEEEEEEVQYRKVEVGNVRCAYVCVRCVRGRVEVEVEVLL